MKSKESKKENLEETRELVFNMSELFIITILLRKPKLQIKEISEKYNLPKQRISWVINNLKKKEVIIAERKEEGDKREVNYKFLIDLSRFK